MKKLLSCILVFALFLTIAQTTPANAIGAITPRYTNATYANVFLSINSSGDATVQVYLHGNSNLKSATVTTWLEKWVSPSWERVDIDSPYDKWVYSTTSRIINKGYEASVTEHGKYRAVAKFTLVADTTEYITVTSTFTY